MKVVLVSSFFSSILLFLGMKFLKNEKFELSSQLFFVFLLLSCYSFFGQALVAKFYPLNTFLIFIIFYLGYKSLYHYNAKYQHIIAFLFGIAAGLHQTTYFMFIPLLFLIILHFKNFIKNFIVSFFLFFTGLGNVIYLIVRSWKYTLLNMSPSSDLYSLIHTLLRKVYGKSSSVDVAKSLFYINFHKILYVIKNIFLLLSKEFHFYSFIFLITGFIYLFLKSKRLFLYFFLTFISYSIFLAYLTFSTKKPDLDSWYIVGHQYYLPLFLFFGLISTYGFKCIVEKLPIRIKYIKYLLFCFPLIYFPQNFFLNFFDKNQVAYYKTIDQFFVKPVKSIVIYSGDNDVFQGWYIKNVEKFRDDLCFISAPVISDNNWETNNGCSDKIYEEAYPEVINKKSMFNLAKLKGYMLKRRVYSSSPIEKNKILKKYVNSYYTLFDFIILPKNMNFTKDLERWIVKQRSKYKNFIHYNVCLSHGTDDLFTKALCSKYVTYLTYLSYDIGKIYKKGTVSKVKVNFGDNTNKILYIYTTKENSYYLYKAYLINKFNKIGEFYLYNGF